MLPAQADPLNHRYITGEEFGGAQPLGKGCSSWGHKLGSKNEDQTCLKWIRVSAYLDGFMARSFAWRVVNWLIWCNVWPHEKQTINILFYLIACSIFFSWLHLNTEYAVSPAHCELLYCMIKHMGSVLQRVSPHRLPEGNGLVPLGKNFTLLCILVQQPTPIDDVSLEGGRKTPIHKEMRENQPMMEKRIPVHRGLWISVRNIDIKRTNYIHCSSAAMHALLTTPCQRIDPFKLGGTTSLEIIKRQKLDSCIDGWRVRCERRIMRLRTCCLPCSLSLSFDCLPFFYLSLSQSSLHIEHSPQYSFFIPFYGPIHSCLCSLLHFLPLCSPYLLL